jgi:hypothetical protein
MWTRLPAIALLGCVDIGTHPVPAGPSARVPPPAILEADDLTAGETADLRVVGAPPLEKVRFFRSPSGLGAGPCHPVQGVCAGLLAPLVQLGEATTDAAGTAALAVTLDPDAPAIAYLQAFVSSPAGPVATNTLVVDVAPPTCDLVLTGVGDSWRDVLGCASETIGDLPGARVEFPAQATSFPYPASTTFAYDVVLDGALPCVAARPLSPGSCRAQDDLQLSVSISGFAADGSPQYSCLDGCLDGELCDNYAPAQALLPGVTHLESQWDGLASEWDWAEDGIPPVPGPAFPVGSYTFDVRFAGWIPDPAVADACVRYDQTWSLPFDVVEPAP